MFQWISCYLYLYARTDPLEIQDRDGEIKTNKDNRIKVDVQLEMYKFVTEVETQSETLWR